MRHYDWHQKLKKIFEGAVERYAAGQQDLEGFFEAEEEEFLASIGYRPIDIYDVAEDIVLEKEPDWETVLLVASVRRDYFLHVQKGVPSGRIQETFPGAEAKLGGIRGLPRILAKARAKLRGELPEYLMYAAGGDRTFFRRHDIHPADFLRVVWAAGDDEGPVIEFVKKSRWGRSAGVDVKEVPPPSSDSFSV